MTKTHALGYFFIATLAVVSAVGIPYGTWLTFQAARNSDGAWNFEWMLTWTLLLRFGVIGAVLGLLGFVCVPSRRLALVLKALVALGFLSLIGGCVIGGFCWQWEFDWNRREADNVVRELEEYREDHGTYPAGLLDLPRPVITTLRRGDYTHEMEYWPTGPGGFTLRYGYGWYEYTYDSGTQRWSRRD
jgi:hypothetical protein